MKKTYIVKYDIFPYYVVVKGELTELRGVPKIMTDGLGLYSPENVLGEYDVNIFDKLEEEWRNLCIQYDKQIIQLRKDLLASSSISDIMQHKIQD